MKQWPQEMLNGITTRSPRLDVGDLGADLLDDAHRLVAEDVALVHERAEHLVEVQVGAADAARGDADDRVGRLLDRRVGDRVDANVALAVPGDCLHRAPIPAPCSCSDGVERLLEQRVKPLPPPTRSSREDPLGHALGLGVAGRRATRLSSSYAAISRCSNA